MKNTNCTTMTFANKHSTAKSKCVPVRSERLFIFATLLQKLKNKCFCLPYLLALSIFDLAN